MKTHPCLSCGACCAFYRVSFHWSETLPESYHVPEELTESITPHLLAMKGTHLQTSPRCIQLKGNVGESAHCGIYERRSSSCREFEASYENGTRNERCDHARASHGLRALTPEDY